jgi:hypothetical protein
MYGEKRVAIKSLRVYTEEHYMKSVQKVSEDRLRVHLYILLTQ